MHRIPTLSHLIKQLEDVIRFNFIPAIISRYLYLGKALILPFFPVKFGELAIPLFHNNAQQEYGNSRKLTSSLTQLVKDQYQIHSFNQTELKSNQNKHKNELRRKISSNVDRITNSSEGKPKLFK